MHAATAFAKHSRCHATLAVTSSIGPGALNMVTGAALATVNRLPVLLLPGDTYATRHQGPARSSCTPARGGRHRQRARSARSAASSTASPGPEAPPRCPRPCRCSPTRFTRAGVLSLPQDIQSHAYYFPAGFFAERDWVIGRPQPDPDEIAAVLALLAAATKPLIIAGGGVIYSGATAELERLAGTVGLPVSALRRKAPSSSGNWWQIGGIGLKAPRRPTPWPARPTWRRRSAPG